MLQSTLTKIKKILKVQLKLQNDIIADVLELLKHYKKTMWLYPGVLKRKLSLPTKDVYSICALLEQEGILKSYYELYCGNCQKSSGLTFEAINQIPPEFECEMCGEKQLGLENTVIIFKVMAE